MSPAVLVQLTRSSDAADLLEDVVALVSAAGSTLVTNNASAGQPRCHK